MTAACLTLFAVTAGISLAVGFAAAAVLLPLAYNARGYWSIGGEWAAIFALMGVAYYTALNYFFRKIEKGGGKR